MTSQFGDLPAAQFATPNYTGYEKWVQVQPPKPTKPVCKQGLFQNCTCPHGHQCGNPNPNPTPSCGWQTGTPCGGITPSPSPSPSCGLGTTQPCGYPSPSPSPSDACTGQPPPCGPANTTASLTDQPAGATATLLSASIAPAGELQLLTTLEDRLRAVAVRQRE
jgi:hypothetical protein